MRGERTWHMLGCKDMAHVGVQGHGTCGVKEHDTCWVQGHGTCWGAKNMAHVGV